MKALAVGADVLVLENEAGSVCKTLAAHADRVCGTFHSGVWTGTFYTSVARFRGIGVSIPIQVVSFSLDPCFEDSQAIYDHFCCK